MTTAPPLPVGIETPESALAHPRKLWRAMRSDLWAGRELAGLDDSAFTMQAAYQAARAVITAHERTELQGIDHAAFFTALDQPAPATPALKAAFQRHQRTVASR